ncbi:MAG: hypothetical protein WCE21_03120 [Candidatus Babeliales bacterium]
MATFNQAAFNHAVTLITAGETTTFDSNWQEEQPTPDEVVRFINAHTMAEYGLWFLGTDKAHSTKAKEHYVYPYGDLKTVQRPALVDTIAKAEKNGDHEIVKAAKQLLELVDKEK